MKIICPVFYQENSDFISQLRKLEASACDLIEVRLDGFIGSHTPVQMLHHLDEVNKPLILTIRTQEEGGQAELTQAEYLAWILSLHAQFPEALIDVQLHKWPAEAELIKPARTILSFHDFHKTPANLAGIWQAMEAKQAAVHKITVMPSSEEDVVRLLLSCYDHHTKAEKIAIAMGEAGAISRVAGELFGSSYTFAALESSSAPGQLALAEMVQFLSLLTNSATSD